MEGRSFRGAEGIVDPAVRAVTIAVEQIGRRLCDEALHLPPVAPDQGLQAELALLAARTGDVPEAKKLAEAINQKYPVGTIVQKYELPTINASIELVRNNPRRAIDVLHVTEQYDLAMAGPIENLYPAYVRGLAYLRGGRPQEAAVQFRKVIEHRGVVRNWIAGALAYLQLGRAQAMMGDKDGARSSYREFLTLWKDADPEIPFYQQAKAEYTKLQ